MSEFREIKMKDYYPCLGCGAKTEPWGIWDTAQESQYCRSCWEGRTLPSEEPRRRFLTCCACDTTHLVTLPADVDKVDGFICKVCSAALVAQLDDEPEQTKADVPRSLPVRERSNWIFPLALVLGMAWVVCVVVAAVAAMVSVVRWAFGI